MCFLYRFCTYFGRLLSCSEGQVQHVHPPQPFEKVNQYTKYKYTYAILQCAYTMYYNNIIPKYNIQIQNTMKYNTIIFQSNTNIIQSNTLQLKIHIAASTAINQNHFHTFHCTHNSDIMAMAMTTAWGGLSYMLMMNVQSPISYAPTCGDLR